MSNRLVRLPNPPMHFMIRFKHLATGLTAFIAVLVSTAAPAAVSITPALFADIEKAAHITEGAVRAKSTLYVFIDPNCLYCHLLWKAVQPYKTAGLQVKWIPVAFQKPSSTGRAAAIMQARDPVAALRENEIKYQHKSYDGGIKPLDKIRPDIARALQDNLALMEKTGAPGTPLLVWKDASGKIAHRNAMPRLSELPQITGLPLQKIDDPELSEFR